MPYFCGRETNGLEKNGTKRRLLIFHLNFVGGRLRLAVSPLIWLFKETFRIQLSLRNYCFNVFPSTFRNERDIKGEAVTEKALSGHQVASVTTSKTCGKSIVTK